MVPQQSSTNGSANGLTLKSSTRNHLLSEFKKKKKKASVPSNQMIDMTNQMIEPDLVPES